MKVLFVIHDLGFADHIAIAHLSAIAKQLGHLTAAVPANSRELFSEVRRFQPEVLAFTATTGAHRTYENLARQIKREHPRLITIVGGPHPTYYPQMIEEGGIENLSVLQDADQPALLDDADDLRRVLVVLTGSEAEERVQTERVETADRHRDVFGVLQAVDGRERVLRPRGRRDRAARSSRGGARGTDPRARSPGAGTSPRG